MKLGKSSFSGTSLVLLAVQLALVSGIAGKYLYQRWRCPRVWTRAAAYDPSLPMRGRYLSLQLVVDGCQSTLPSAKEAAMPRNLDGVPVGKTFLIHSPFPVRFPAKLTVKGNTLVAIKPPEFGRATDGLIVEAWPGTSCRELRLHDPVAFYIAEHAATLAPMKPGQELWIEVTVPPHGPPRPIQLALKDGGAWRPLAYE
jgi:hypothetical protein